MRANNYERLFSVTSDIETQLTDEVFDAHPGMGAGTGNILDTLATQIPSVIGTLTGTNEDNSSGGNPTVTDYI